MLQSFLRHEARMHAAHGHGYTLGAELVGDFVAAVDVTRLHWRGWMMLGHPPRLIQQRKPQSAWIYFLDFDGPVRERTVRACLRSDPTLGGKCKCRRDQR